MGIQCSLVAAFKPSIIPSFFFFFLTSLLLSWDLTSLTKDATCAPCSGSVES